MQELLHWDQSIFHLINSGWQNSFFDWLMPILRNKYTWVPLYLFIASFLCVNYGRKGIIIVLAAMLSVGISDAISSHLIKKTVQRERPCKELEEETDIHLLVNCGSGYSFPSSHASNHFSLSVFLMITLGTMLPRVKIPLLLWATVICYAQIYVGVHYPSDVLAGSILGTLIAMVMGWLGRTWIEG